MPHPKNLYLLGLFNKNNNKILCNNGKCCNKILNNHSVNLERHLKLVHSKLYSNYIKLNSKNDEKIKIKPKICKELNKRNIELAIVELFTMNGRLISMIEDRAFQILMQPAFDTLNASVNSDSINEQIIAFSQNMKTEIIEDRKGRLLSLKIDAATTQSLTFLGIHVQYIKNKIITIKTLAIRELKSSHTSEYVKSVILNVLKEYKIDITQILTITTANGTNMQKAVNDLNSDLKNCLQEENNDDGVEDFDCDDVASQFLSYNSITGIRCGAHTLQLCVQDVLKNLQIKEKLKLCRSVAKKLRTQTYLNILNSCFYNKPILDSETRWISTFNMLERLLELEEIINLLSLDNSDFLISADKWSFVKEFITIFRPIYTATSKLQSEQLCFSELYVVIMDILFQTENMPSTEMTGLLTDSLNHRIMKLFSNELFNAAIFLDPRIKVCLSADQRVRAKKYIISIYKQIISLKETNSALIENTSQQTSPSVKLELSKTFSEFLQNLEPVHTNNVPPNTFLSTLETDFLLYDYQQRIPLNSNILEFWNNQTNTLSVVAEIVLAIPITQVSIERLFSALNCTLADQRNRLTTVELEHMLLVKLNGIFDYND